MTISRVTTWNALDILTASALNGEFDNTNNNAVSTGTNDIITGKKTFSGANTLKVPAAVPTETQGAGFVNTTLQVHNGTSALHFPATEKTPYAIQNLSLSLSAGVLSVVGLDGAAISSSNPAYVVARNATGGFNVLTFTSAITFNDDAHADSNFVGTGTGSWGTTAAVAWADTMPFLLGVCTDGTTPIFVMARLPVGTTGASTNIGYKDVAPSSANQANVWALTSTDVTTTHANQPITWVGSFRMVKSASDDWTVQAFDYGDGIGNFYNFGIREFSMPVGQNGAKAGIHFNDTATNEPAFSTTTYKFTIDMRGAVAGVVRFFGDGGTDGTGTGSVELVLPLKAVYAGEAQIGCGLVSYSGGAAYQIAVVMVAGALTHVVWVWNTTTSAYKTLQNGDFTNGVRTIEGHFLYRTL
jgi:hypothetical protein